MVPSVVEGQPTAIPGDAAAQVRRIRAVEAYCREFDPVGPVATAAAEILSSLTGRISDDNALLRATRTAAVKQLAGGRYEGTTQECALTPARLANRANGTLSGADKSALEQHLASCLVCRAAELRSLRADRAFAAILALKLTTNH